MKTLNLSYLIAEKGKVRAKIFHSGYVDEKLILHNGGDFYIEIHPNNLTGGYVGNTLLIEAKENHFNKSHTLIKIEGNLFLNCLLVIKHEDKFYQLKKVHNYLRLKAKILI